MKINFATVGLICAALGASQANAACSDIEATSTCSTNVELEVGGFVVVHGLEDVSVELNWDGTNSGQTRASMPLCIGTNARFTAVRVSVSQDGAGDLFSLPGEGSTSGRIPINIIMGGLTLNNGRFGEEIVLNPSRGVNQLHECTLSSARPINFDFIVQNSDIAAADSGVRYTDTFEVVIRPF